MADDVRIATGLRTHRKTKRLRRALGGDGCWGLICLFLWAGEERWTGDLSGLSDADLEEEAGWEGEPGALIASLVSVGFLHGEEFERRINDWEEHNPYAASKGARIQKGKTAAAARWDKERQKQAAEPNGDAPSMPGACHEHAAGSGEQCPPAPAPTPTPSDGTSNTIATPAAQPPTVGADAPRDYEGVFEGHENPHTPAHIAEARKAAIALSHMGHHGTAMNETLLAFFREGGSVEHLVDVARQPTSKGKPIGYLAAHARRELHAEAGPAPVSTAAPRRLSVVDEIEQNIRAGALSGDTFLEVEHVRLPR